METKEQIEKVMAKRNEEVYRNAFTQGVALHYHDERTIGSDQFIQANPDGSEQLVRLDSVTNEYIVIKNLTTAGNGRWGYLATALQHG